MNVEEFGRNVKFTINGVTNISAAHFNPSVSFSGAPSSGLGFQTHLPELASSGSSSGLRSALRHEPLPSHSSKTSPRVAILLCTFHGQHYLADQLESFAAQTYPNWVVYASDDASTDSTHSVLGAYQGRWNDRLAICAGPSEGFASNFLSLTCRSSVQSDYYAYSDQDDIWEPEKLERAVSWLNGIEAGVPALYCSRTQIVDAENGHIGYSPLFKRRPSFANALMQNIGGGNTMVFNDAARKLLCKAGHDVDIATHDWWAYLVVTGCGGQVHYDSSPTLRYRQHGSNLVGCNSTWSARAVRLRMLWQGRFKDWNDRNIKALQRLRPWLTAENCKILDEFSRARNARLLPRLAGLWRSGVYRQTLFGNLGLIGAAIFKKI
ncbi:MAG: glycosyltransferase family 2 protein [Pseudomonadota bacterium]